MPADDLYPRAIYLREKHVYEQIYVCRSMSGRSVSMGVHLMGVHLMGMHLIGVDLIGMHLMGVHLIGMHLIGVHLTGMYLIGVYGHASHGHVSYEHASYGRVPHKHASHRRVSHGVHLLQAGTVDNFTNDLCAKLPRTRIRPTFWVQKVEICVVSVEVGGRKNPKKILSFSFFSGGGVS